MTRFLLAGAAALGMLTSAAMAQTVTSDSTSTTITTPPSYAPVPYTTERTTGSALLADGDRTDTKGVAVKVPISGDVASTQITTKTYPFTNMITTITKTTRIANGMATEDETTSYETPGSNLAPTVIKTTRTYQADAR